MEMLNPVQAYGGLTSRMLLTDIEATRRFGAERMTEFIAAGVLTLIRAERVVNFIGDFDCGESGILKCEVLKIGESLSLLPVDGEPARKVQPPHIKVYEAFPEKIFEKITAANGFDLLPGSLSLTVGIARRKVGLQIFQLFIFLDETLFIRPGVAEWMNARIGSEDGVIVLKPSGTSPMQIGIKGMPILCEIPSQRNGWLLDRDCYCGPKFNTPVEDIFKIYPEVTVFVDQKRQRIFVRGHELDIKGDAAVYKFLKGICDLKGRRDSSENFAEHVLGCTPPEKRKKTVRDAKSRAKTAVKKVLKDDLDCDQVLDRLFPRSGAGNQGLIFSNAEQREFLSWL